ncbi:MAG: ABC transporter permease subunit, partial [Candidatus Latescibacterota bacterium]
MATLFWHQVHDHFLSLRVQLSLGVVLAFFVLNGLTYSWRILDTRHDDVATYADMERSFDGVQTVAGAASSTYRVLNQPTGTEFMTEGGFNWFWGTAWVTPQTNRFPDFYYGRDVNIWMDRFEVVDWTLIVKLVFSFLCIAIAYDDISGECERGTLRLVLANSISRGRVLAAKYAANLTVLLAALGVGAAVSLLILSLSGAVPLTWTLLLRCALYAAA